MKTLEVKKIHAQGNKMPMKPAMTAKERKEHAQAMGRHMVKRGSRKAKKNGAAGEGSASREIESGADARPPDPQIRNA